MPGLSGSTLAYKQNRAGIARADAVRANYFTYNVIFTLNSVDVSSKVMWDSPGPQITQQINSQPNTATFTLKPGSGVTVVPGQIVTISFGCAANVEFGGQVLSLTLRGVPSRSGMLTYQDVTCIDYTRQLGRRIVNSTYTNQSASTIATDLVSSNSSGFTTASITTGLPSIDNFMASNETVPSALTRLANMISGGWYVDGYKNVHFYGVSGDKTAKAGTAPVTLASSLATFKGGTVPITLTSDLSQQRTEVLVEGKSTTCPTAIPGGVATVLATVNAPVDYLAVAGGGGGGANDGGGGGGGGVLSGTDSIAVGSYAAVIGNGGAGGSGGGTGANGAASTWNAHSATGGGGGGGTAAVGSAGGSGGGGNYSGSQAGGLGTAGQGNTGGTGSNGDTAGGGGGGATAGGGFGGTYAAGIGGFGGAGLTSSISGSPVYYAGGGGGGGVGGGTGGDGSNVSGGNGGSNGGSAGHQGIDAVGGGGGGGKSGTDGNNGGSGVVVLSYPTGSLTATGGTITTASGRTIHTFTSNGTFAVSAITVVTPASTVTDLPLTDATQLSSAGGYVRVGNQVAAYSSTIVPTAAAVGGSNPPGTTVSSDAVAGATSIALTDASQVANAQWIKVGEQFVKGVVSGGNFITIPATGFGSLSIAVKAGTQVTAFGSIVFSSAVTFTPAQNTGASVIQRVPVISVAAYTAQAAIEGGDGLYQYVVPQQALTIGGAEDRGAAETTDFGFAVNSCTWETEDLNARAGRPQALNLTGFVAPGLVITQANVTFFKKNAPPRRRCTAATVLTAALLDVAVIGTN